MGHRRASTGGRLPFSILVSPVFLGSVAVLLANDHFLKWTHPGPITGKVSDFAGPVMVATAASVVVGRRIGFALTALGFVALKTVPGAAEAAAPVLGGVTSRDPTDLVGLLALLPLWRWTSGRLPCDPDPEKLVRPGVAGAPPLPVSRAGSRALPLAAASLGLVALTATSPPPDPPEVVSLWVAGSTVYAEVTSEHDSDDPATWAMSTDGGRSWIPAENGPPAAAERALRQACRTDGTCFEALGGSIRETRPDGEAKTSFELSGSQREALRYRRPDRGAHPEEMFFYVAVVPGPDGESVVVNARDQGAVVLGPSGGWKRLAVLGADPTPVGGSVLALDAAKFALFASGPFAVVAAVAASSRRRYRDAWANGAAVVGALLFGALFWGAGLVVWALGTFNRTAPNPTAIALAALALGTVIAPIAAVQATGFARGATAGRS